MFCARLISCDVLDHLHSGSQIAHRDIKPQNSSSPAAGRCFAGFWLPGKDHRQMSVVTNGRPAFRLYPELRAVEQVGLGLTHAAMGSCARIAVPPGINKNRLTL